MAEKLQSNIPEQKSSKGETLKTPHKHPTPLQHYKNIVTFTKPKDETDTTLGCRYEMKYVISESTAAAIVRFIKPYLHYDRYCKSQPRYEYPIASLYLDSPDLRLCRESLEGHKNRFKLRIRAYNDDPEYPRFLEIKRRANTIILKSRARITHGDVIAVLSGKTINLQNKDDDETFRQFWFYMKNINAGPVVTIRYMREAYENDLENRVRVTFDRCLCYKTNSPELSVDNGQWQRHHIQGIILEIKFTGSYPAWLAQMVEYLNLYQQSVSKYATSVQGACALGFCAPKVIL
jgi:hypothetical protein